MNNVLGRSTDLTLEQLVDIVTGRAISITCAECQQLSDGQRQAFFKNGHIPREVAASEIGLLFSSGTKEAEGPLLDMLQDQTLMMIAYFYLFHNEAVLSSEALARFDAFESIHIDPGHCNEHPQGENFSKSKDTAN